MSQKIFKCAIIIPCEDDIHRGVLKFFNSIHEKGITYNISIKEGDIIEPHLFPIYVEQYGIPLSFTYLDISGNVSVMCAQAYTLKDDFDKHINRINKFLALCADDNIDKIIKYIKIINPMSIQHYLNLNLNKIA
jgi:hypothetical protein